MLPFIVLCWLVFWFLLLMVAGNRFPRICSVFQHNRVSHWCWRLSRLNTLNKARCLCRGDSIRLYTNWRHFFLGCWNKKNGFWWRCLCLVIKPNDGVKRKGINPKDCGNDCLKSLWLRWKSVPKWIAGHFLRKDEKCAQTKHLPKCHYWCRTKSMIVHF